MKKIMTLASLVLVFAVTSCSDSSNSETQQETTPVKAEVVEKTVETIAYTIVNDASVVNWSGEGVGHGHKGTVNVSSGKFAMEGDKISTGIITIDMTSIVVSDIEDPKENAKLTGHFKNEDFFNVEAFPVSTLEIIDASDMRNTKGKITIKGVSHEITFPLISTGGDGKISLESKLTIDRTKFGITYSSGNFFEDLGDYLIDDIINLNISLKAKAQ